MTGNTYGKRTNGFRHPNNVKRARLSPFSRNYGAREPALSSKPIQEPLRPYASSQPLQTTLPPGTSARISAARAERSASLEEGEISEDDDDVSSSDDGTDEAEMIMQSLVMPAYRKPMAKGNREDPVIVDDEHPHDDDTAATTRIFAHSDMSRSAGFTKVLPDSRLASLHHSHTQQQCVALMHQLNEWGVTADYMIGKGVDKNFVIETFAKASLRLPEHHLRYYHEGMMGKRPATQGRTEPDTPDGASLPMRGVFPTAQSSTNDFVPDSPASLPMPPLSLPSTGREAITAHAVISAPAAMNGFEQAASPVATVSPPVDVRPKAVSSSSLSAFASPFSPSMVHPLPPRPGTHLLSSKNNVSADSPLHQLSLRIETPTAAINPSSCQLSPADMKELSDQSTSYTDLVEKENKARQALLARKVEIARRKAEQAQQANLLIDELLSSHNDKAVVSKPSHSSAARSGSSDMDVEEQSSSPDLGPSSSSESEGSLKRNECLSAEALTVDAQSGDVYISPETGYTKMSSSPDGDTVRTPLARQAPHRPVATDFESEPTSSMVPGVFRPLLPPLSQRTQNFLIDIDDADDDDDSDEDESMVELRAKILAAKQQDTRFAIRAARASPIPSVSTLFASQTSRNHAKQVEEFVDRMREASIEATAKASNLDEPTAKDQLAIKQAEIERMRLLIERLESKKKAIVTTTSVPGNVAMLIHNSDSGEITQLGTVPQHEGLRTGISDQHHTAPVSTREDIPETHRPSLSPPFSDYGYTPAPYSPPLSMSEMLADPHYRLRGPSMSVASETGSIDRIFAEFSGDDADDDALLIIRSTSPRVGATSILLKPSDSDEEFERLIEESEPAIRDAEAPTQAELAQPSLLGASDSHTEVV
ncbi:hypothetical protein EMMF5_004187 [Cystobasidiomycetes sp. EMM_F5]